VVTNQARRPLPYALRQRARQRGWRADARDVSAADVGLTAVTAAHRAGVNARVPHVTRSQGGLMLAREVTRLSRHLPEGSPLLDICGAKGGLSADRDGVDDPAPPHGRRLRGLKGTWSEMARQTIRARLTAGRLPTAARGALALALPRGLGRAPCGPGQKTPDLAVQPGSARIFAPVRRVHTARPGCAVCQEPRRSLPGRERCGDLEWKTPTGSAISAVRQNPASAGAGVEGRSPTMRPAPAPCTATPPPLPRDAWQRRVHDTDPASMSWETDVQVRARLTDPDAAYDRHKTRGLPRAGAARLPGLL
jgi:DNA invertase Pin-like site-specific DNA recombinase